MKKYLLVLACAVLMFAVTGCGKKNQLKCTGTMTENGVTIKGEVVADLDKDNKLVDATATYDLGNKETADQYCSLLKAFMVSPDNSTSVSCSGTKVTIKGYANAVNDEEESKTLVGMTKEEFIKAMEEQELTCK